MMLEKLGALNALLIYGNLNYNGLTGYNPIIS
jgi:hypothetical protein